MMQFLDDEEARVVEGQALVMQEIANGLVEGKQYFTAEELVNLIVKHLGPDIWAYRKSQGVQPIEW